jgi:hypothetical protein
MSRDFTKDELASLVEAYKVDHLITELNVSVVTGIPLNQVSGILEFHMRNAEITKRQWIGFRAEKGALLTNDNPEIGYKCWRLIEDACSDMPIFLSPKCLDRVNTTLSTLRHKVGDYDEVTKEVIVIDPINSGAKKGQRFKIVELVRQWFAEDAADNPSILDELVSDPILALHTIKKLREI